jgi:hypothetical protein
MKFPIVRKEQRLVLFHKMVAEGSLWKTCHMGDDVANLFFIAAVAAGLKFDTQLALHEDIGHLVSAPVESPGH